MKVIFSIALLMMFGLSLKAQTLTQDFNFDGYLLDASSNPIPGPVAIKFQIYDPSAACLVFEETFSSVTPAADGSFSLKVGTGTRASPSVDGGLVWNTIFQNSSQLRAASSPNCTPGYIPAAGEGRKLRVTVGGVVLSPDYSLSAVPMATVAETVQGVPLQGLTQNWTTATRPQNPVANTTHGFNETLGKFEVWNGAVWFPSTPKFSTNAIDGTATDKYIMKWNAASQYWEPTDTGTLLGSIGGDVSGTYATMIVGAIRGQPVSATAPNTGEVLKWNGTQWQAAANASGVSAGTGTDTTLRWNGTAWVETDGATITAVGDVTLKNAPTANTHAATKLYVDTAVGGITVPPVSGGAVMGDILKWDGSSWLPTTIGNGKMLMGGAVGATTVTMSQDVTLTNTGVATVSGINGKSLPAVATDGQIYFWDNTSMQWKVSDMTGLADGSVMKWDNTTKNWKAGVDAGAVGNFIDSGGGMMTGRLQMINPGSASLPSLSVGAGVDTGIFSPSFGEFGVSTAGVEQMRIDATGKVGIGTTSPTASLDVNGGFKVGTGGLGTAVTLIKNFSSTNCTFTSISQGATGTCVGTISPVALSDNISLNCMPAGVSPSQPMLHSCFLNANNTVTIVVMNAGLAPLTPPPSWNITVTKF